MTTRTQDMYSGSEPPPWDIGAPQQAFVDLVIDGEILGEVLDAGCGTGALACYLANQHRNVLGIDLSPEAIRQADARAMSLPDWEWRDVGFQVHSALDLPSLGFKFDSIVDCGLFHQFSDEDRTTYLLGIGKVLRVGGRFYALVWSDQAPPRERGPRRYSRQGIADVIHDFKKKYGTLRLPDDVGWDSIIPALFANRVDPEPTPSWMVIAEKI